MLKRIAKRKKGQVTVFIVIGILILGIVLGMVYMSQHLAKEQFEIEEEEARESSLMTDPVKMFVESCLESTAEEGLYYIGMQGGYYETKEPFREFSNLRTPYYFYLGEERFPEKETIQEELSKYIKKNLNKCTDFSVFEEQGYIFSLGDISANSIITTQKIIVDIKYPIEIRKGGKVSVLNSFTETIYFDFGRVYDFVKQIVLEQREDTNSIPLGFINNLAYANNFLYTTVNIGDEVLYSLFFESGKDGEEQYSYDFLVKYDWSELGGGEEI